MAYKRLQRITAYPEPPTNTWVYVCDAEADIASLPLECVVAVVAEPDVGKSAVRIRNASGVFKELE